VSSVRALVAAAMVVAAVGAGCSALTPGPSMSNRPSKLLGEPAVGRASVRCDPAGTVVRTRTGQPRAGRLWPERLIAREGPTVAAQAVDPTAGLAYVLVSQTARGLRGPYVLECISLRSGAVHHGPVFPPSPVITLNSVVPASGYLWVSELPASSSQPVVTQLGLRTLTVIRSLRLPTVTGACSPGVTVATGPPGSVWIGSFHTLLRLDTAIGAIVTRLTLPADVAVSDIAVDPGHRHLYVSITHVVKGGCEGNAMLEYGARSGRRLATATRGLITDSVIGAQLTAVPGGVWASFRTGMLGLTIHLRQQNLAMIAPPGSRIALTPAARLFHWAMGGGTIYGGGVLWLANQGGWVACINPRTGQARAAERIPFSRGLIGPLAANGATHQVIAAGGHGLIQVTPPTRCWQ